MDVVYKFHRTMKIDTGAHVTVWSADTGAMHEPPTNLVMKGQKWFVADHTVTVLLNNDGEVRNLAAICMPFSFDGYLSDWAPKYPSKRTDLRLIIWSFLLCLSFRWYRRSRNRNGKELYSTNPSLGIEKIMVFVRPKSFIINRWEFLGFLFSFFPLYVSALNVRVVDLFDSTRHLLACFVENVLKSVGTQGSVGNLTRRKSLFICTRTNRNIHFHHYALTRFWEGMGGCRWYRSNGRVHRSIKLSNIEG